MDKIEETARRIGWANARRELRVKFTNEQVDKCMEDQVERTLVTVGMEEMEYIIENYTIEELDFETITWLLLRYQSSNKVFRTKIYRWVLNTEELIGRFGEYIKTKRWCIGENVQLRSWYRKEFEREK